MVFLVLGCPFTSVEPCFLFLLVSSLYHPDEANYFSRIASIFVFCEPAQSLILY